MPNLFKKLTLIAASSILILNSLATPYLARAQGIGSGPADRTDTGVTSQEESGLDENTDTWYSQEFPNWYSKVYGEGTPPSEIFGERYTAAQVEWILYSLFSFILNHLSDPNTTKACIGGNVDSCSEAITETIQKFQDLAPQQSYVPNEQKSLVSLVFAKRSFSGIGYIADKINNFTITPSVNAQTPGFGYGAFEPIQAMWSATANFAYAIAVLVIIIFSFMIMFRIKISPQVVISVQSALPKVVIALIFVFFSYPIAGFMVDLMYVVIGLLSLVIGQVMGDPPKMFLFMTEGAPLIGGGFLGLMAMYCVLFFWTLLFTLFASGNLVFNVVISPILFIIFTIAIIVVAVVMIFMFFKILWLLLKTLAQTYLLVIFAPLQIMMGTLSQGMGMGTWIRSLIANLAVYPVVGVLFALSYLFLFYSIGLGLGNILDQGIILGLVESILGTGGISFPAATWAPPLTFGETYIPIIFTGVSFAILTMIPKTAEIIQGVIAGKPLAYGSAIGESITGPFAGALRLSTAVSQVGNAYSTRFGFNKAGASQQKSTPLEDDRKAPKGYGKMHSM